MKIRVAITIMLLVLIAIPAVADDVDKWIQDLKDPVPAVREASVDALIELNDTRAVEPLIRALEDEDVDVREAAAEALGKLNGTRVLSNS